MVIEHPVPPFFEWISGAAVRWPRDRHSGVLGDYYRFHHHSDPSRSQPTPFDFLERSQRGMNDLIHLSWQRVLPLPV